MPTIVRILGRAALPTFVTGLLACQFPALPPIEEDAAADAAGPDVAVGPAALDTEQGAHDFGAVVIGELSAILQVTVRNTGGEATGPLSVTLVGANADEYRIVPTGDSTDCVSARLSGGQSCVAQVRYAPSTNITATARLEVSGNPGGSAVIPLMGDAITPANLTSTQGAYDFGDIVMGQPSTLLQVVVRNDGEQSSGAISVTLGGAHAGDFTIVPTGMSNDCAGAALDLQDTCIAQVRFQPTVAATRTASLLVTSTPGGMVTVPLTGDGLSPGNLMVEMPTGGASLDFGTREIATGATSATQTIRIRNTGGAATGTLDVTLTGGGSSSFTTPIDSCDNTTLGPNGTCDVQVRFNPTAVGGQPATVAVRDTVAMTAASVSVSGLGSARASLTKTGQGTVVSNPTGINCGTGCSSQTQSFTQTPISLSATADSGWIFSGWSGSSGTCTSSNPSDVCSLVLDQGVENVGALFTQVFVLNVSTTGSGTVTSASPGILCGNGNTDCSETYPVNTMVTLNAEPDAGWEVFSWSGTGVTCNAGARMCTVTMNQMRTVGVEFRRRFTLTVAKSDGGDGSAGYGSVASTNVSGITCGADCSEVYFDGQVVTLNATSSPVEAATLSATPWSLPAGFSCATNPCSITITQSLTATANYQIRQYDLIVTKAGNGAMLGSVMRDPAGTSCGTDCTRHPYGTDVTLSASASTGAAFISWNGGGCPMTGVCMVDMTTARNVTATFTLDTYTLTLNKTGAGVGTVTSDAAGINCGTACTTQTATYNHGQTVTLSYVAGADSTFVSWGGSCSGATCSPVMTQDRTVTANFKRADKTLTVNVAGAGTVTSMDGGISAPTDSTETYLHNTMVTLMASWNATSHDFVWSGACSGSLATCTVTMDQAQTVTATFTLKNWTLTVAKAGVGSGTVTSMTPAGIIDCGIDCTEVVSHNTMVTLSASPTGGDIFYGWSGGGCSGTGTCTTTVTAATTVTATFDNCARSTQSCTSNNFLQCDANGDFVSHVVPNGGAGGASTTITYDGTYACPMGCHATLPRCNDISAVNGLNAALDATATSFIGYDLLLDDTSGDIIIDTSTFNAGAGTITVSEPSGQQHVVPATLIAQTAMSGFSAPNILALEVRTFTIGAGARVKVRGASAFAVASHFDIYIAGHLDLSGPSLGAGMSTNGSFCNGVSSTPATGGGGNQTSGFPSSSGGSGGNMLTNVSPNLQPLEGGCGGGAASTNGGGRGGGAVQLVTRTKLTLAATGIINVSGFRGFGVIDFQNGAVYAVGGGSGGGILLESPSIAIVTGGRLAGRGGSGGAANRTTSVIANGNHGDWDLNASSVPGATCTGCGVGGNGGTESSLPTAGTGTSPSIAGGGAAVGRCHLRDRSGAFTPPAGTAKISVSNAVLGSR